MLMSLKFVLNASRSTVYSTMEVIKYLLDIDIGGHLNNSIKVFTDSRMFIHLLLAWGVSLIFCWKIFPAFNSSIKKSVENEDLEKKSETDLMPPPTASTVQG